MEMFRAPWLRYRPENLTEAEIDMIYAGKRYAA